MKSYYTEEELAEQESHKKKIQEEFDSHWALVEGYYESDSGDSIGFFTDEKGARMMSQGGHNYSVNRIEMKETFVTVFSIDGPFDYAFDFKIASDGTCITVYDYSGEAEIIYNRR